MNSPFRERIETFQQRLGEVAELAFFPISADLQYLTGLRRALPNFGAVLHPGAWLEGGWLAPAHGPLLTLSRMSAEFGGLEEGSAFETQILGDWEDPAEQVRKILERFQVPEAARIALGHHAEAETAIGLHRLRPAARFLSATDLLQPQRAVKSEAELDLLQRAGAITEAAFADVLPQLRLGMTELEVMSEVDFQLRRHGSLGPSFVTALYCSGPQHPLIFGKPHETQGRRLDPPVAVLFDFGAIHEGYCYDFGRTVSFGAPDDELQQVHTLVMESQAAGIAALRAGETTGEQADAAARAVIELAGYGEAFRHRLGHGIGLDVHEPPFLTKGDETRLEAGMTFTVEPSITQFQGFSARVEDIVAVGESGGEPLTSGFGSLAVVE